MRSIRRTDSFGIFYERTPITRHGTGTTAGPSDSKPAAVNVGARRTLPCHPTPPHPTPPMRVLLTKNSCQQVPHSFYFSDNGFLGGCQVKPGGCAIDLGNGNWHGDGLGKTRGQGEQILRKNT